MIQAPFSLDDLDLFAEDFYKLLENEFSISAKIDVRPIDDATPVFNYIKLNLKEIIIGRPHIGNARGFDPLPPNKFDPLKSLITNP